MGNININFYFTRNDSADYHVPFHSHKCYELIYYYTGKGHCKIGDNEYDYDKNTFAVVPPEISHNDVHQSCCSILCIGFTVDSDPENLKSGTFADDSRIIYNNLKIISDEFKTRKENFMKIIQNCMSNIFISLQRSEKITESNSLSYSDMIKQAINYIDEYYLFEISPEQLAEITNYSYHRFRHVFKSITGLAPKQYILAKRIEYAKQFLTSSEKSITEIGYLSGFSSTSFFIKTFKEKTGVTPAKYRKQLCSDCVFSSGQSSYDGEKGKKS